MFHWKFGDGTTVYSRARVEGSSPFAEPLRRKLVSLVYGCGPIVWLTAEQHGVELDPSSNELLALWLEQEARQHGQLLRETDYLSPFPVSPQPKGGKNGTATSH